MSDQGGPENAGVQLDSSPPTPGMEPKLLKEGRERGSEPLVSLWSLWLKEESCRLSLTVLARPEKSDILVRCRGTGMNYWGRD